MINANYMLETNELVIRNYYAELRKKDKGQFLRYLIAKYKFSYVTLVKKLSGNSERAFTVPELLVINNVIEQQAWKESSSSTAQTGKFISSAKKVSTNCSE